VEIEGVEEWKVEKILNKRKVRGVMKYLVWWKEFTAENNSWEKEENLKNAKGRGSRVQRKDECESKTAREVEHSRRKRL